MKKTTVTFGEYLKHKREERQISLREVARTLGVSAPFLSDVENNRRVILLQMLFPSFKTSRNPISMIE